MADIYKHRNMLSHFEYEGVRCKEFTKHRITLKNRNKSLGGYCNGKYW